MIADSLYSKTRIQNWNETGISTSVIACTFRYPSMWQMHEIQTALELNLREKICCQVIHFFFFQKHKARLMCIFQNILFKPYHMLKYTRLYHRVRYVYTSVKGTGHQAVIGHQQLSDAVELYSVFLHTRESRHFRWGKGRPSKSQNTKK